MLEYVFTILMSISISNSLRSIIFSQNTYAGIFLYVLITFLSYWLFLKYFMFRKNLLVSLADILLFGVVYRASFWGLLLFIIIISNVLLGAMGLWYFFLQVFYLIIVLGLDCFILKLFASRARNKGRNIVRDNECLEESKNVPMEKSLEDLSEMGELVWNKERKCFEKKINVKFCIFAVLLLGSYGCSSHPVVISYSPSTLIERKGLLSVEGFNYKMKDDGEVMENEIQKTTVGDLIIDKKVSDLVENAIKLELKFSGISVSNKSNNRLSGSIERLFFDDLGVNLDTDLKVKYILTRQGKDCFSRTISTSKKSPKFSNPTGQISETIKENIETLLKDENFIACIE